MTESLALRDTVARRVSWPPALGRLRYPLALALVVAGYYGAAKLGFELAFSGPIAAILWLPVGVGIASLYLGGLRLWPAVLVGDLLVNDYSALSWGAALPQTVGNTLEVVIAAALLRRLVRRGSPLDSVQGVGPMLLAIAAGTFVSAVIGPASLVWRNVLEASSFVSVSRTWWLGDACGALVVAPLMLAWASLPVRLPRRAKSLELLVLFAALAASSQIAFHTRSPLSYLVFPPLTWAALRFGHCAATFAISVVVAFAVWHTVRYTGPFHFHSITDTILNAQLFIAVVAITTLTLSAVVSERRLYAARLAQSRARIVEAADGERRRLERNLHDGAQHRLTGLLYLLSDAREHARTNPADSASLFANAQHEVATAIDELRELAHGIHPAVLTDLGLANALRSIAARSPAHVELVALPSRPTEATAAATAYYLVAEAVTNAARHAGASTIRISVSDADDALHVVVEDDGRGGATMDGGTGLQGLSDRVEAVGGTFSLDTAYGRGTRIDAVIPLRV